MKPEPTATPTLLAVMEKFADGGWHHVDEVELSLRQDGLPLRETCRTAWIVSRLEIDGAVCEDKNQWGRYQMTNRGCNLLMLYREAEARRLAGPPPSPKPTQRSMF